MTLTFKKYSALFLILLVASALPAQEAKKVEKVYKVNPYISTTIGVVGASATYFGIKRLRDKEEIPLEIVLSLDKYEVNPFDRKALFLNPENRHTANTISDIGQYITFAAPIFLLADKRIRNHWLDIGLLYFETQSISTLVYAWTPIGPQFIERYRPETYYDELKLSQRQSGQNRNSFFSGHALVTATGSFFIAKVISDYHPELGGKKWLLYGAALVPPAFVSFFRVKALRHFPTDTIAATVIGGAIGFLIPHFHKKAKNKSGLSFGTNNGGDGIALSYQF
jgi:membrane-associated phospholipid phosphatase